MWLRRVDIGKAPSLVLAWLVVSEAGTAAATSDVEYFLCECRHHVL